MISSYTPRLCGIATFCEEAREFIQKANPDRDVLVISHADGEGAGVIPVMQIDKPDWWKPVANEIARLKPHAIHIQHEYGLYEYLDDRGVPAVWPWTFDRFRQEMAAPKPEDYELR